MTMAAIEQGIGEMVETAQRVFGPRLRQVVLYGSYARGEADDESDVDLLIVADGARGEGRDRIIELMSDLCIRIGRLIVPAMVDTKQWQWLVEQEAPIALNIQREGRVLWPPQEDK
jgi:predicted nucleotidyltransferase